MTAATGSKRLLLVDAVVWSTAYDPADPRLNVHSWYARWLADLPSVTLARVSAEEDVLGAARQDVDGIIISGSPRDAWKDDPVNDRLCELIRLCQTQSIPLLGVCYGHQILARALGGIVARHPDGFELGNTPVELTGAGRASPLFEDIPTGFDVISSHADAVLEMPPGAELTVRGDYTLNQGFHWRLQLFGVQFHPETDPDTMRFIWQPRRELWRSRVKFDLDATLDRMTPTPLAGSILRNFAQFIVT